MVTNLRNNFVETRGDRRIDSRSAGIYGFFCSEGPREFVDNDVLQPKRYFGCRLLEELEIAELKDRSVPAGVGPAGLQCRRLVSPAPIEVLRRIDHRDESSRQGQEIPLNEMCVFENRPDSFVKSKAELVYSNRAKHRRGR